MYINEDFPDKLYCADNLPEADVITRKYLPETSYEKLPCWELTSFHQYLNNPMIEGRFSNGLYNVVGWTFGSPYTWDPYGLQHKLMPIIQKCFIPEYLISFHKAQICIKKYETDMVLVKEYLDEIYSSLAIQWIKKYDEFPPVNIETLLYIVSSEIRTKVLELIRKAKEKARTLADNKSIHQSGKYIFATRDEMLDEFIKNSITTAESMLKTNANTRLNIEEDIAYMYNMM